MSGPRPHAYERDVVTGTMGRRAETSLWLSMVQRSRNAARSHASRAPLTHSYFSYKGPRKNTEKKKTPRRGAARVEGIPRLCTCVSTGAFFSPAGFQAHAFMEECGELREARFVQDENEAPFGGAEPVAVRRLVHVERHRVRGALAGSGRRAAASRRAALERCGCGARPAHRMAARLGRRGARRRSHERPTHARARAREGAGAAALTRRDEDGTKATARAARRVGAPARIPHLRVH